MRTFERALLAGASALALGLALSGSAWAQSDNSSSIETVTVTGIRGSLESSIQAKRASDLIVEAITTKDIGQLPDVTIAEELNRLPGLNTTLDRGNASQAAVRGLGPRLVLGLVNGREVASSEPDQNVRWEIYPSEVVGGVKVYKSQSSDLISGGIAATIDIDTVKPLDYTGPELTLRAGPEYNAEANNLPHYSPWGMRASGAWIKHLTDNFAIALSASFQRQKNGYESFQGWGYNLVSGGSAGDVTGNGIADATPWGAQTEVTEIQQDRKAFMGAAQWTPNAHLEINFDALYSGYDIKEDQFQAWYGRNGSWGDYTSPQPSPAYACYGADAWAYNCPGGIVAIGNGGVVTGATQLGGYASVTNVLARYDETHSLFVTGLNAKWTSGQWIVDVDASYSEAQRNNRWQALLTEVYPPTMVFNTASGATPLVQTYSDTSLPLANAYNPADPTIQNAPGYVPGQSAGPELTKDHLASGRFDVTRAIDSAFFTAIDAGVRYSSREKSHRNHQWYECPTGGAMLTSSCGSSYTLPSSELSSFNISGFTAPPLLYSNFDQLASQAYTNFQNGSFSAPAGSELLVQHWNVQEDNFAGFAKVEFAHDVGGVPMAGNLGVRITHVSTTSTGYQTLDGGVTYTPVTAKHDYTDVLPSLNLNFHLTDEQIVRFGAAIAVSRPPLDELRTGFSLSTTPPLTGSGGNPFLNPYKSKQLDLDYEYYFHKGGLFAAAVYYKHLDSFIGYGSTIQTINGNTYTMYAPENAPGGDLEGVELTFQTPFYFLPGFLDRFGIYSNYAYVNSNLHELAVTAPGTGPLDASGLAEHTGEVDLWYSAKGLEARLAYKVHSPYTIIAGWNSQSLTRLDWSELAGWQHLLPVERSHRPALPGAQHHEFDLALLLGQQPG